jgi:hypothetical protein
MDYSRPTGVQRASTMPGSSTTPGPPGAHAPVCIAFRLRNGVSTRNMNLYGAQWLAYVLLCRRFAAALAGDRARFGVDVDRYSFIGSDLHRLTKLKLVKRQMYSLPVSRRTAKDSGHYRRVFRDRTHGNREIPPSGQSQGSDLMNGRGKSDSAIVAERPTNEAGRPAEEPEERRAETEGNAVQQRTRRAQNRESVSQALDRIRQAAGQRKKEKFTALLHHISPEHLEAACQSASKFDPHLECALSGGQDHAAVLTICRAW